MIRYYVLVATSFLVAIGFHVSVYHRFGDMQEGLLQAARIKHAMESDEQRALSEYHESVELHRKGIADTLEAFKYANEAKFLSEDANMEEEQVAILKEDAKRDKGAARVYEEESAWYGMESEKNMRASMISEVSGLDLAHQAMEENDQSEKMMKEANEDEKVWKARLHEAQHSLEVAERAQSQAAVDKGICRWASSICQALQGPTGTIENGADGNQYSPVTVSDDVIKANNAIQMALWEIQSAETKRARAIELHYNASIHVNQSVALLNDAKSFKTESLRDSDAAKEYFAVGVEDEIEAEILEEEVNEEELDIALKRQEARSDFNHSMSFFHAVMEDRNKEQAALKRMDKDLRLIHARLIMWREKKDEAVHHVTRAGWEALAASIAGSCLLVVVLSQIFSTFRYRRPLRWVLRDSPYFLHDLLYLICHILIFFLAMGYVGELLRSFHSLKNVSRIGITAVFALDAAMMQVILLHLVPSMCTLIRESKIDRNTMRSLMKCVVMRKGVILALVSAIEMLLCWCWMGDEAFAGIHVLNSNLMWIIVACMIVCYWIHVQKNRHAVDDEILSMSAGNSSVNQTEDTNYEKSVNENERHSLLMGSYRDASLESVQDFDQGSFCGSFNNRSSEESSNSRVSSVSMRSIPMGSVGTNGGDHEDYGSLVDIFRAQLSASPVRFSWKNELEKVRLLFEFFLVSVSIWIVRRDLSLIRKLSPLATDLVWGRAPLWILNTFLFIIFISSVVALANAKTRIEVVEQRSIQFV